MFEGNNANNTTKCQTPARYTVFSEFLSSRVSHLSLVAGSNFNRHPNSWPNTSLAPAPNARRRVKMVSQDPALLESEYAVLNKNIDSMRRDFIKPQSGIDEFVGAQDQAKNLRTQIQSTAMVLEDSKFMYTSASLVTERARNVKVSDGAQVDMAVYLGALKNLVARPAETVGRSAELNGSSDLAARNMAALGKRVYQTMLRPPTADFMVGPIDINRRTIVRSARSRLDVNESNQTTSSTVSGETEAEKEASLKCMLDIYAILAEYGEKIDLHNFVTNPNSFSQTVENLFFVSFLVRDGKVALSFDDSYGLPVPQIQAITDPTVASQSTDPADDAQHMMANRQEMVVSLDMDNWRQIIELWGMTEPIIPHRDQPDGLILRDIAGDAVADDVQRAIAEAEDNSTA